MQGAVDKRTQENERAGEENDFHGDLLRRTPAVFGLSRRASRMKLWRSFTDKMR
jgi:hypothetical protein